ncbi:MAG: ATP-binding protein [Myxococcales bacterium]
MKLERAVKRMVVADSLPLEADLDPVAAGVSGLAMELGASADEIGAEIVGDLERQLESYGLALRAKGDIDALREAGGRLGQAAEVLVAHLGEKMLAEDERSHTERRDWHRSALLVLGAIAAAFLFLSLLHTRAFRRLFARAVEAAATAEFERGRLEALLRHLPVPVVRTSGSEHRIDFANEPLRALWRGEAALGRPLRELHPELSEAWDRAFSEGEAMLGGEVTWNAERDGASEPVHLSLWLEALRSRSGEVEGVLGVATDVTGLVAARANAERLQSLSESLSRSLTLAQVVEVIVERCLVAFGAQAGYLAVPTPDGASLRVENAVGSWPEMAAEAAMRLEAPLPPCEAARSGNLLLVRSFEELAERFPDFAERVPVDSPIRAAACIPLVIDGRSLGVVTLAFYRPRRFDDPERALMLTAGRLCAQALERASLYEAEKRAHTELQKAIDARDEFLSVASHELRTPLTVVQLQMQRAIRFWHGGAMERMWGALTSAERSVRRLGRLVDNLLDFSQVRANRMLLELEPVELGEAVREVAERFCEELARSGSELEIRVDSPVVGLWDRLRIEQVASNLLSNAIKFGGGKPIRVEAAQHGETARLTVRDGGLGILPEDQERIFRRFERAVSARHFGGLGLGLWATRQSVEALGGTIEVKSEPGVSSTFVVTLPCGGPAASLAPGGPPPWCSPPAAHGPGRPTG